MTGLIQPQAPRPSLPLRPRRSPLRWLKCKLGRHEFSRRMAFTDHSDWRTVIRYCKHCHHIDDIHARRRGR